MSGDGKRHDDDGLTSGPAAWMVISAVVVVMVGLVAWTYAGFVADRRLTDALVGVANDDAREALRQELDLIAQSRMATAAVVGAVLSGLSAFMLAGTVWLTLRAAEHARESVRVAQEALEEARSTSRRELMPYLVSELEYTQERIDDKEVIIFKLNIGNYGRTPCFIKRASYALSGCHENLVEPAKDSLDINFTLVPDKHVVRELFALIVNDGSGKTEMFIWISVVDAFHDGRMYSRDYLLEVDYGRHIFSKRARPRISVVPNDQDNPLRSWVGDDDGTTNA